MWGKWVIINTITIIPQLTVAIYAIKIDDRGRICIPATLVKKYGYKPNEKGWLISSTEGLFLPSPKVTSVLNTMHSLLFEDTIALAIQKDLKKSDEIIMELPQKFKETLQRLKSSPVKEEVDIPQ